MAGTDPAVRRRGVLRAGTAITSSGVAAQSVRAATRARTALAPEDGAETELAGSIALALEAALKERAPGLYASTPLVLQLAQRVGRELGLDAQSQALLAVAVRVRDIGMVALPDAVVLATRSLSPADWELVNRHPILGADLLEGLSPVAAVAEIVRCHHERWDGEGYPNGRRGTAIPVLSRVIAICDAFVAMASDRPYRRGIGTEAALEHIQLERGSQFDPSIADTFVAMVAGTNGGGRVVRRAKAPGAPDRTRPRGRRAPSGRRDLASAIADFDVVPAFAPAYERAFSLGDADTTTAGEMVAAIESDVGLTVAVLRRAQSIATDAPIANVTDAVGALSLAAIREAITSLPHVEFPWQTTPLGILWHNSRLHSQAVTRAADGIARELALAQGDDLLVAALLHDIGKLVVSRSDSDVVDARSTSPEDRVRIEQRVLGLDHARVGALLLRSWGLPERLVSTVAAHHSSDDGDDVATYVRLADMLAHHAQGDAIDRTIMLRVAHACDLSPKTLRDVLFDLPHSGGSRRLRAERSPMSARETEVLRLLAQGKVYTVIADELDVAVSTVRSHLHKTYEKLGVADRAQAVLRATEMAWI
jgi:putative nucleotidyltransferase with HDIG domain